MKKFIFIFVCFFLLFSNGYSLTSEDVSFDKLQEKIESLGISDLNVDLNLKVPVPANPGGEAVELWATAITHDEPCPTIFISTPYRREIMMMLYLGLVTKGYNLVGVDIRGTGSANGQWVSFGPSEHYDNAWIIDNFIPSMPSCDGRVGMIGPSYMAISQLLAAGQIETDENGAPVHLKALFPMVSKSDAYKDIVMHGGSVNAEFIPLWLGLVDILSALPPLLYLGEDGISLDDIQEASQIWEDHLGQLDIPIHWIMDIANAEKTDFYETKSAMIYWPQDHPQGWNFPAFPEFNNDLYNSPLGKKQISEKLPVFMTGGWFDIFTRGTINNYMHGLKNHSISDKALVMGPWYHLGGSLGLGVNSIMDMSLPARWFDWKIKGINDPFMEEFSVLSYVLGKEKWKALKNWPPSEEITENETFYLSKRKASLIFGDWFSTSNYSRNYKMKESLNWTDTTWLLSNPLIEHSPLDLKGLISRSSSRWLMGLPALVSQASKLVLNLDIDSLMPWEDERIDEDGVLTFTTEPLDEDIEVAGPFKLTFYAKTDFKRPLSSLAVSAVLKDIKNLLGYDANLLVDSMDRKDVQWIAEINDVQPNGRARNITSGWLTASHRPYDPNNVYEITPGYDPAEPFYDYADKNPNMIEENKIYKYSMEIWPTHAVFKKGHRIRLSISNSDFPHLLPILHPSESHIVIDSNRSAKLEFTKVKNEKEGELWKWVDDGSKYLTEHSN